MILCMIMILICQSMYDMYECPLSVCSMSPHTQVVVCDEGLCDIDV